MSSEWGRSTVSEIYPGVAAILRDIIGLTDVDVENPLHVQLADAITNAGPNAPFGVRVVALRYVFNWQLNDAGAEYARAKADYEHAVARKVVEETATAAAEGRKIALGLAEKIAEVDAYDSKLTYLLAEQRERSMRNFLGTLGAALDLHRTDRSDQRAADKASAQGYGGGA